MKKFLSVFMAFMLVIGVFAGCRSESEAPKAETESKTLNILALTASVKDITEKIAADYKAQTGVTINWQIPGEDYYTLLKTRFAANNAPDIFQLTPADLEVWGVRCTDLSKESWINHTTKSAITADSYNGKVLGMSYGIEGSGFIYNKDLFAKAGITQVPKTLNELQTVSKKLKGSGIQPFGEAWKNWGFLQHIFGTIFAYQKSPKESCEKLKNGELKIQNLPYLNEFFKLYDLTLTYGLGKNSIAYDYNQQFPDFAAKKMAMIKQGTWCTLPLLKANEKLNIGLFAVPLTNDASQTKLMVAPTGFFSISNTSKNASGAKQFLNFLYKNAQKYFVDEMKLAIPFDNVDISQLGPLYQDMKKYVDDNMTYPLLGYEYWPSGFQTDIATPLQAYAAKSISKDQCIQQIQSAYTNRASATTS